MEIERGQIQILLINKEMRVIESYESLKKFLTIVESQLQIKKELLTKLNSKKFYVDEAS